jgi:hypothetical protein
VSCVLFAKLGNGQSRANGLLREAKYYIEERVKNKGEVPGACVAHRTYCTTLQPKLSQ